MKKQKGTKVLHVERVKPSTMYRIKFNGGGRTPNELRGLYTSKHLADKALELFVKTNGKTASD